MTNDDVSHVTLVCRLSIACVLPPPRSRRYRRSLFRCARLADARPCDRGPHARADLPQRRRKRKSPMGSSWRWPRPSATTGELARTSSTCFSERAQSAQLTRLRWPRSRSVGDRCVELYSLSVAPAHSGQGIGTALLDARPVSRRACHSRPHSRPHDRQRRRATAAPGARPRARRGALWRLGRSGHEPVRPHER
jgi:hypothetical protein